MPLGERYEAWLASLAEGSIVILDGNYAERIGRITWLTNTQFLVDAWRFNRRTGKRLGDYDRWNHCWLREPTPDKLLKIETRDLIEKLTCVSKDTLGKLPIETLREAAKLLTGA